MVIPIEKMRLSNLRKFTIEDKLNSVGKHYWTSKKLDLHIEIMNVRKDGVIEIYDHKNGIYVDSETYEIRHKNPNFWDVEVLKFNEKGLPKEIKKDGEIIRFD